MRPVRYHTSFTEDLKARTIWLGLNRPQEERDQLRIALAAFAERLSKHPAMGRELTRRDARSYRVFPIGARLPYLVLYYYDALDDSAPVWLAMLLHEAQDRERFDPSEFE